jgi:hypothetical protein
MSSAIQDLREARIARLAREFDEQQNTDQARYELSLTGLGSQAITDLLQRARAHKDGLASAISPTIGRVWAHYSGNGVYGIVRSHAVTS